MWEKSFRNRFIGVIAAVLTCCAPLAHAQGVKPIKLVVPFPAGGTSDILARLVAKGLATQMHRNVIVENKPGAGTIIGAEYVAKSPPDGATLLLTSNAVAINPFLYKSLPYDTQGDLEEVILIADQPMAIYAAPGSKFRTLQAMLATAKQQPGTLNYGTAGVGSTGHLTMKLLEHVTGIQMNHVPFQGSAPSMNALLGGHTDIAADTVFLGAPQVKAGKLVAIATLGKNRSKLLPDVPTASESAVPGFTSDAWFGISVRRGTPSSATEALNRALNAVIKGPAFQQQLENEGFQLIGGSRADAAQAFSKELDRMKMAVQLSGATASNLGR